VDEDIIEIKNIKKEENHIKGFPQYGLQSVVGILSLQELSSLRFFLYLR
jgi:hypothetical protein